MPHVVALLVLGLAATGAAQSEGEAVLQPSELIRDDSCAGDNADDGCALSALQRRAATGQGTNIAPDDGVLPTGLHGEARWSWGANLTAHAAATYAPPPSASALGHGFMATTTRYGTNSFTSCDMDSAKLVEGTPYLSVASAQGMQNMFPGGEGSCCRCGRAGPGTGGQTAGMGCGTCARGRFVRQLPRGFHIWTSEDAPIFRETYHIVVADICPKGDNGMWCPATPNHVNSFGVFNHFDFAVQPKDFDNFYFAFTPEECSPEIKRRLSEMSSCHP